MGGAPHTQPDLVHDVAFQSTPPHGGRRDAFSQWGEATLKVHETGLVYKKADGTPALNPYLRVAREAYSRMMQAAVLLGLSPSSRVNLKVEKPKPQSKAEKFMARKGALK